MAALDSGTHAPQVALPDLKGKTVSLSVELKRGPVVLAFFKISCPVCQYALPILERLHRAYPNAAIYGVSQNSAKDTERFRREFGVTFPMLLDDPNTYTASNAYGLTNVPTVFYIGRTARLRFPRSDGQRATWKRSAAASAPLPTCPSRHCSSPGKR